MISYYDAPELFGDIVQQLAAEGIGSFGLYYPTVPGQIPGFEHIATQAIPDLKRGLGSG